MEFIRRTILYCTFCAAIAISMQAQVHETVYGDVYLAVSPVSSMPVHWRGKGPDEGWTLGINTVVRRSSYELFFEGRVGGGAPFDNPESLRFSFGGGYFVTKKLAVIADIFNLYSLNDVPVIDRKARTPTSGINQMWVKARYEIVSSEMWNVRFLYGHGVRGNLPLYFPVDASKPYASQYVAAELRKTLAGGIIIASFPELYFNDEFNKANAIFHFGVERPVLGQLVIKTEIIAHANLGVPEGRLTMFGQKLKNSGLVRFGISLPFGNSR